MTTRETSGRLTSRIPTLEQVRCRCFISCEHHFLGLVGAPACGDVMKLQIKVDDDGKIVDSCFKTFGCASAIASSSVATEWVKGQAVDKAAGLVLR